MDDRAFIHKIWERNFPAHAPRSGRRLKPGAPATGQCWI
jgi:hypothetical protein